MLNQHLVLQNRDLGEVITLADDHRPIHRLPPGQELSLGHDRGPTATSLATLTAALLLGLQSGGTAYAGNLILWIALLTGAGNRVLRVIRRGPIILTRTAATPPTPGITTSALIRGVLIGLL